MNFLNRKILICYALTVLSTSVSFAGYMRALPNNNLQENTMYPEGRLFTPTERFTLLGDVQAYHRFLSKENSYHGTGHWTQLRAEVRLNEHTSVNLRSIMYNFSSSNGYAKASDFYNLVGANITLPDPIFGGIVSGRLMDVETQTLGAGLILEDDEFFGGDLRWDWDAVMLRVWGEGTGVLVNDSNLAIFEVDILKGLVGTGVAYWWADAEKRQSSYYFLYSKKQITDWFGYAIEGGTRNSANAYMAKLNFGFENHKVKFTISPQYRVYEDGFGKDFVANIGQGYIAYDQYDKSYTSAKNVFVDDDDAQLYAIRTSLYYKLGRRWFTEFDVEAGEIDYKGSAMDDYFFHRIEFGFKPFENRPDTLVASATNKLLAESVAFPPERASITNRKTFVRFDYLAIEANFHF